MSISFVQSNSDITNATSLAFTSPNGAGNLLIVLVTFNIGQAPDVYTVDDTNNNVYSTLGKRMFPTLDNLGASQLFYAFNSAPGANTVSWHASVASTVVGFAIYEFSGVNALDVHSFATGSGASQDSGPITTNFPDSLLFGYEAGVQQNSVTPEAGWTVVPNLSVSCLTQYQIVSSIGTYNSTTTTTSGKSQTTNWAEEILAFYQAASVSRTTIIEF